MPWQVILVLIVVIPVILFPAAFVWYLNIGGIYAAVKEARERRAVREGERKVATETKPLVAVTAANEQRVDK